MSILDEQTRERALDPSVSFIVQAPAGSGKTELLTQRYLVLLTHVQKPEEIIALTFTRKAAAEMKQRILAALQLATDDNPLKTGHQLKTYHLARAVLAHSKQLGWDIVNNPYRLRVQTIDSLCTSLVYQMPVLARCGIHTQIAEKPQLLYQHAARAVLTSLEEQSTWSPAITNLFLHLDNQFEAIERLLIAMLARREQWLPHLINAKNKVNLRQDLEQGLQTIIKERVERLKHCFSKHHLTQIERLAKFAAQNLIAENSSHPLTKCNQLPDPLTAPLENYPYWLGIVNLLLTSDKQWRKSVDKRQGFPTGRTKEEKITCKLYKQEMLNLLEQLAPEEECKLACQDLLEAPPAYYNDEQWQITADLIKLLLFAAAQLLISFNEHNCVDFTQVALAASTALGEPENPTSLALNLDYQIQHLLVDEFQDTSIAQFQLLEKLTVGWQPGDNRSLFLVGDPMQSIYRFRQAEVGLFLQAQEQGLGDIVLEPLTLTVNFRSQPALINWTNQLFQDLLPKKNNINRGAVAFKPSTAFHSAIPNSGVFIQACDEHETTAAWEIVKIIQDNLQKFPAEKIAILVKARSHLRNILPVLQKAGIAYHAVDIEELGNRQIVRDLLALTQALLHLGDDLAWLAILRAPWCGLLLADLNVIANEPNSLTLWDKAKYVKESAELSIDGKHRLQRFIGIMELSLAQRERYSLREWVENTWIALAGPACLTEASALEDAHAYFETLEKIFQTDLWPDGKLLAENIQKLFANNNACADANVQILTFHKAKGLEFDVVILPELQRITANEEASLLLWMERTNPHGANQLLLAPIKAAHSEIDACYQFLRREESLKNFYENNRLLYVGVTRAKRALYLLARTTIKLNDLEAAHTPSTHSFLGQLWPYIKESFLNSLSLKCNNPEQQSTENSFNKYPLLHRLNSNWYTPSLNFFNSTAVEFATSSTCSSIGRKTRWQLPWAKKIGIFIHRILQEIATRDLSHWQKINFLNFTHSWQKRLAQSGMPTEIANQAIELAQKTINNIIHDPRGRWLFDTPHQDSQQEYVLSYFQGNQLNKAIIDRTFIDEQGYRWIIDYKIVLEKIDALAVFLQEEVSKHKEQLEQYAKIFQLIEQRPIRLALYFPTLPAWHEWEF